jgi:hypothetical protein
MRSVGIALLLLLAAPAVATAGTTVAVAVEDDDVAEGDIVKYDPLRPPPTIIEELYPDDIDTRTFILVERALLVPDRIVLVEGQDVYHIEVVDEQELDRYEPVVAIRLAETFSLANLGTNDIRLQRYEQRMWREGFRLTCREYEGAGGAKVRYTAFRVSFETCGDFYRATLTLYKWKSSLSEQLDTVSKQLGEIVSALRDVRQEVSDAGKKVRAAVDGVRDSVASVAGEVRDLNKKIEELDGDIQSLERRITALERSR